MLLLSSPSLNYGFNRELELLEPPDLDTSTRGWLLVFLLGIGVSFFTATSPQRTGTFMLLRRISCLIYAICLFPVAYIRPDPMQLIFLVILGGVLPYFGPARFGFAVVTLLYVLLIALLSWRWYQSAVVFSSLLYYTFALFAVTVSSIAIRERSTREELAAVNSQLLVTQRLLTDSAIQAERLRISRDLHDSVGHHLTALSLQLEVARHLSSGKVCESINNAHTIAKLVLVDVRQVVSDLRIESRLDIRKSLEQLAKASRVPVRLTIPQNFSVNHARVAEAIFRFVQEIITNNNRHSRASWISITLQESDENWTIYASDDVRTPVQLKDGSGLAGMRERAESLGGTANVDASQGLTYRISLPKSD